MLQIVTKNTTRCSSLRIAIGFEASVHFFTLLLLLMGTFMSLLILPSTTPSPTKLNDALIYLSWRKYVDHRLIHSTYNLYHITCTAKGNYYNLHFKTT